MNENSLRVLIDTSPLANAHATRGVGAYTRFLTRHLEEIDQLQVKRSATLKPNEEFNPGIVHYPYFDLFFSTLPLVKGKKTVVTIHDVIPLIFPKHYPPGVKGSIKFHKQKLSLRTVKKVITDSQASKHDIEHLLQVPAEKIEVVMLAANPEIKPVKPKLVQKVKKKYQLPKQYVLYVGDINYNKNIPQLIKAFRYLPEQLHLVLVGKNFVEQDIHEWQWIQSQVTMSAVESRVHFISNIESGANDDLSAIYCGAFCYLQPSLYEGFGLPILEAMKAKTPVVATNNSSLPEVCGGHAVMVEEEAQTMAEGIKQVLAWDEKQRTAVIKQALQWAQSFTWQKTAQQTYQVYQTLVS